ncbi:MAG: hypothetical protein ACI88H_000631 [Cocleimonas sp.]|jgi:hypothetical protein
MAKRKNISELIESVIPLGNTDDHSDTTVMDHLLGTYRIMVKLQCPEYVCIAGACHNIYETEKFKFSQQRRDGQNRKDNKLALGVNTESLVYLFSRLKWRAMLSEPSNLNRSNISKYFDVDFEVNSEDFIDILRIFFANIAEQKASIPDANMGVFRRFLGGCTAIFNQRELELWQAELR